ncbi:uncharacterized protein [Diadema setosum]|uniref:uncharacterized protein n=1 Tax=Diadema setosum TaxID=31175 RepID=UPI003B3B2020
MASKHTIEECVQKSQSSQGRCTYQTPSNTTFITLTCVVSGFKPGVSIEWTDESGQRLKSMTSQQTALSDDTYERFEKINVSAKHGTEQTFVCIATGDSLNGTSTTEITLLPASGKHDNVGLIIGLVIGIPAAGSILFLLVRKFQRKCDKDCGRLEVSEDSPPNVQTALNIEDESKKWYSVQWADFKLYCRRLKDVSTQHPRIPFWLYAVYRFALAAYFFALLITHVVFAEETLGPKFLIYLEAWTYITATYYVNIALVNTAIDFKNSEQHGTLNMLKDKFRYQIQWFLFNLTATPSIITTFDWGPLYFAKSEKVSILLYVSIYLLPSVVCLIEIFLTLIVVRFLHVVYPALFLISYLLFTVIYWVAGGTDPFGNPFTYYFLDFGNYPGIAAAHIVGFSFATLLVQAILKGLYILRVRCMDSQRTEAAPPRSPTEEASAVELEGLTT